MIHKIDPTGEKNQGVTGPCEITVWAGDTLQSQLSLMQCMASNLGKNAYKGNPSVICPSQYMGFVGCGAFGPGGRFTPLPAIPGDQQIPDFPIMKPKTPAGLVPGLLRDALNKADAFAGRLCDNRKKFCDDGTPERYRCGADNQRCDSVTIIVSIDSNIKRLLRDGIGTDGETRIPGVRGPEADKLLEELIQRQTRPRTIDCLKK